MSAATIPPLFAILLTLLGSCQYGAKAFTLNTLSSQWSRSISHVALGMVANDISGKTIAAAIRQEIKKEVEQMQSQGLTVPGLAVILVGSRRDSQTYVNMKTKACTQAGIASFQFDYDDQVMEKDLVDKVAELNADSLVHGILVQLPLPEHIDQDTVLSSIDPEKDVDGLHPVNVARLAMLQTSDSDPLKASLKGSFPCTPLGCMELLLRSDVQISGKHAVVIGRSSLVGLPMFRLLLAADATVTLVHSRTKNIAETVKQGDIVVAAVGKPLVVKKDWIKEGAVVIDVGINSVDIVPKEEGGKPYKLVGDVDYENVRDVCSMITPVPGGVGPMTIAMLLRNTLNACKRSQGSI